MIDLNADVGEGAPNDAQILAVVSSANIACGAHAGDAQTMRMTCRLAGELGVRIGAHPGYPDRDGFGRREVGLATAEITATVASQLGALEAAAREAHARVGYVKLHGALYHRAAAETAVAAAVLDAIEAADGPRVVLCPAGSELHSEAVRRGYRAVAEGFADRRYAPDGSLVPRDVAGSVLSPGEAATQAVELARGGLYASLCLHGDGPDAAETAAAIFLALQAAGVRRAAFA